MNVTPCIVILVSLFIKRNITQREFFECHHNGNVWEPVKGNGFAQIFFTMHIMMVLTSALQCERVFFSIPEHLGLFKLGPKGEQIKANIRDHLENGINDKLVDRKSDPYAEGNI